MRPIAMIQNTLRKNKRSGKTPESKQKSIGKRMRLCRTGKGTLSYQIGKGIRIALLATMLLLLLLAPTGTVAQAAGIVDDTVDTAK